MIFQDPFSSLNPKMTVREILSEPLYTYYPFKNIHEIETLASQAIKNVGLKISHLNQYPHEFSGG